MCAFVPRSADLIFRQLPIKMFHLLVGGVSALCVCVFRVCEWLPAVKMFHLSAGSHQDVPSFGGEESYVYCTVERALYMPDIHSYVYTTCVKKSYQFHFIPFRFVFNEQNGTVP